MPHSSDILDDEMLPKPVVDEHEEILDESKMEDVRRAMKQNIKDDLDAVDGESSTSRLLSASHINILHNLEERSKYIPMRLDAEERQLLCIVEGALDISEYTDKVDVSSNDYYVRQSFGKEETMAEEIKKLSQGITGLAVCGDNRQFGTSILSKDLEGNEDLIQRCLEIGRRYKIMNPDKMRSTYGKLLYAIMDSGNPRVKADLKYQLKIPIKTVHYILSECQALHILKDPLVALAASEIDSGDPALVAKAQKEKNSAIEELVTKYTSENLTEEQIRLAVSSISDNISFLRSNRGPVDKMIGHLKSMFNPNVVPSNPLESLCIKHGKDGSKLSHSHETQFYFVLQSLTLWREIMGNFFKLWILAETDLLEEKNYYRLANTGQGMQRCQAAPRVAREMARILADVKSKVGKWIGLSVVHLGDRDVPNALIFIDKYTQVPRILAPIASTIDSIDDMAQDESIASYIAKHFHSTIELKKQILASYFRNGFDGSGDDGGSCIDGRITSSWEWTSKLEKKPFYSIFMLSGFSGFDGDFRE